MRNHGHLPAGESCQLCTSCIAMLQPDRSTSTSSRWSSHSSDSRLLCSHRTMLSYDDCSWHVQGPTSIREGLYTGGYLGVCPVIIQALEGHPALQGYPSGTSTAIGGVTAGLLAVLTTQPFDTIKTRMQAFAIPKETPEYKSSLSTMRHVVKQGGSWTALWSGIAPRAFRLVGATFILNGTKTYLVDKVETSRTS